MDSDHDARPFHDHLERPCASTDTNRYKKGDAVHPLTQQMIATLERLTESAQKWSTGLALGAMIVAGVLVVLGLVAGQADLQSDVALMHEHGKADR
jgi:hypothetical protein